MKQSVGVGNEGGRRQENRGRVGVSATKMSTEHEMGKKIKERQE